MQDLIDKLQLKVKSYKHQAEEAVSSYLGLFTFERCIVLNLQCFIHRSFQYKYTFCVHKYFFSYLYDLHIKLYLYYI